MLSRPVRHFLLLLFAFQFFACGGGNGDTTAPYLLSQTPDRLVSQNGAITVVFSESMDTSSLTLGGDLAAESNGGAWSNTGDISDTLTIQPATTWSANTNRTLVINARDIAGNALPTLTITHDMYRGTLFYVRGSLTVFGNDLGDGLSPGTAKRTIVGAMDAAAGGEATIVVSSGIYAVSVPGPGNVEGVSIRIELQPGISLYGGYSYDFLDRDPASMASLITDSTSSVSESYAIRTSNGVTSTSIIDGFIIQGSQQTGVTHSRAIQVNFASTPIIQNNTIHGGSGSLTATGIYLLQGIPEIYNNTIYGGGTVAGSSNTSVAINVRAIVGATQPVIRNNTIHGGYGDIDSTGIRIEDASPGIDNNIILTRPDQGEADTGTICITEIFPAGVSSTPQSLRNNTLFNCETLYLDNESGCSGSPSCTSIADVNGFADVSGGVNGNISEDAVFADIDGVDDDISTVYTISDNFFVPENDWHFSAASPATVSAGGLNGIDEGWGFTTDIDGVTRPASGNPWSMGAFE